MSNVSCLGALVGMCVGRCVRIGEPPSSARGEQVDRARSDGEPGHSGFDGLEAVVPAEGALAEREASSPGAACAAERISRRERVYLGGVTHGSDPVTMDDT